MQFTETERRNALSKAKKKRNKGGRPIDPDGDIATARKHGFNPSTWRNRMKKVRDGKMTMEEAINTPVQTKKQVGKVAAKARRESVGDRL